MGLGSFFKKLFGSEDKPASGTKNETRFNENPTVNPEGFENQPEAHIPGTISEMEKDEEIRTDSFTNDKNNMEEDLND